MILLMAALLFALPFVDRDRDWAGQTGFWMTVYFAALTAAGMAALLLGAPQWLPLLPWMALPAAVAGWMIRRRQWRQWMAQAPATVRRAGAAVIGAVLILAACEPAGSLPMGWDSTFHALLAQKILQTGQLSENWLPFSAIPLNYPPGIHILLAEIAAAFQVTVPYAERQLQFALMVPAALLAGSVAARAFRSPAAGWFAGIGLAFWGDLGTAISFRMWGGYPTALGLLCFFALCRFALSGGAGKRGWCGAVLCWGCLGMSHHLTVVITGLIVAAYGARVLICRRRRREWPVLRRLLLSGVAAVIAFIPAIAAIFRGAGDFHSVNAFNFSEEAIFRWRELLTFSGALLPFGAAGIWLTRSCRRPGAVLLRCWLMVLAAVFLIDEYPYRLWCSRHIWGIESTVFPASRFLTAMALPLAGFAGAAVACRHIPRRWFGVLSAVLITGGVCRYGWAFVHERQYDIAGVAAQINAVVPDNAYLVVDLPTAGNTGWIAYLTGKPGTATPIPASENRRIGCFGAAIFGMPDSPRAMEVRRAFVEAQQLEAWLVTDRDGPLVIRPYDYQSR